MKVIVWIGTKDNPKKQQHTGYESEQKADALITYLSFLFPDLVFTKEIIHEHQ